MSATAQQTAKPAATGHRGRSPRYQQAAGPPHSGRQSRPLRRRRGQDGNTLGRLWTTDTILLAPAQRADVLVRAGKRGTLALEQLPYAEGFLKLGQADLLTRKVSEPPVAHERAFPPALQPFDLLAGEA